MIAFGLKVSHVRLLLGWYQACPAGLLMLGNCNHVVIVVPGLVLLIALDSWLVSLILLLVGSMQALLTNC